MSDRLKRKFRAKAEQGQARRIAALRLPDRRDGAI